jgi:hypothetical protein
MLMPILLSAAEPPKAELTNGEVRAKIWLPDQANGFYRATRFDWSGMIDSVEYGGHRYYGPWFQRTDPKVHDFIYDGADIVAGPCTAATGPAEEFSDVGFNEAQPGGTFLKIGVGVLRRPDAAAYDHFKLYEVVDAGKWTVKTSRDSVEFRQQLHNAASGYGYDYTKVVRLAKSGGELTIEHRFRNTGRKAISSRVYNHNFLVMDGQGPGPDIALQVPFEIASPKPPEAALAEIRGKQILYRRSLQGEERVSTEMNGFGKAPADYDVSVVNSKSGAGVRITADRPLVRLMLWSIRAVLAVEPFVEFAVQPGETYSFTLDYHFTK